MTGSICKNEFGKHKIMKLLKIEFCLDITHHTY